MLYAKRGNTFKRLGRHCNSRIRESATYIMERISLELKLISCRDLKAFNFFNKLSVYAKVSIFDDEVKIIEEQRQFLQQQKTPVDRKGGGNPEWNHKMEFDLKGIFLPDQGDNLFLRFKLRCEGMVSNRTIGEVRVPIKDLVSEFDDNTRFVSYQVRSSDGKPNGVLNFSYKVNMKAKKKIRDQSPKVEPPSAVQSSPKKVHYCPTQEVKVQSQEKKRLYPSLDNILSPPQPTVPYPEFHHLAQELYTVPTPLPFPSALAVDQGAYYHHQYPPQFLVQRPGPYWCPPEAAPAGCGYRPNGPQGYPSGWAIR